MSLSLCGGVADHARQSGACVAARSTNLSAGSLDERLEVLLRSILVPGQFCAINRISDGRDRWEDSIRECQEPGFVGQQLHPEPSMSGSCPKAVRLRVGIKKLRIRTVITRAKPDEPEADDASPKLGDRPGERDVGDYPLLAQPLIASKPFGTLRLRSLEHERDG